MTVDIVAVKQGSLTMISVKGFNQSEIVYHPGVAKFYDLGLRTFLIYFEWVTFQIKILVEVPKKKII